LPDLEELKTAFGGAGTEAGVDFSQGLQQTPPDFSTWLAAIDSFGSSAVSAMQTIRDSIAALFAKPIQIQGQFTGFGGQPEGAPFAGGGRVSGPGSWTSDSILARLSRDEFVQPAQRVSQYGLDFMEAIRRGLLSVDAVRALMGDFRGLRFGGSAFPRFAEGGAVTGGGKHFTIAFAGQQFAGLTGPAKVVDALEREAALRSIASTGIAQSFVGRR